MAQVRCDDASALSALYGKLPPMAPKRALSHLPVTVAYRYLVEGHIFEHSGQTDAAVKSYRSALSIFKRAGFRRRGTIVAMQLWKLTGSNDAYAYALESTSDLPSQSWLRREVEAAKSQAVRLTQVQHEVLALICQGKSNPEIARLRKRSLHTIRNLVARLFEIFEVSSREELAVQSVRRGLYTPS